LVVLLATIFIGILVTSAADGFVPQQRNPFLLGAYFKARQVKEAAEKAIAELEAEIRRNREVADRSRKLMELAAQRSDDNARRAEQIAAQALRLAEESLARNEKTLAEWRGRKSWAEKSMAELMRLIKEGPIPQSSSISLASSLGGRARVIKPDGTSLDLGSDSPGFLSPGDVIKTAEGTAELQSLGGRATTQLDRDSELAVMDETCEAQSFELVRGRLHGMVDKVDSFLSCLKQGFEDYREDLGAIKDYFSDDELKAEVNKRLDFWFRWRTLTKVTAAIAVRGTEYLIQRYPDNSVEVWVLDGEVELTFPGKSDTLTIKAGYRCSFNENGQSAPVPFDTVERWWEK
jgi:hypothetical protein